MNKILFIFGTRPEAIKLAPLIKELQKYKKKFTLKICVTAQHREMLDKVLSFFKIKPDWDLNLMIPNQSLFDITTECIKSLEGLLDKYCPDLIFVQGDTTTTFIGALAGYYKKSKLAHIEAGLRSHNKYSPFPEEMNRILADHLSDYHFAPTERAKQNLWQEGIRENTWVVGNTVIDALLLGLKAIEENQILKSEIETYFTNIRIHFNDSCMSPKIILVTGHRRENFGKPFENICLALKEIADKFEEVEIIYPVHLNPNVIEPVNRILKNQQRIHLLPPLEYPYLIWIMSKSHLVLTDSGGIQEEVPSLGKPVLVMRDVTERTEVIESGIAKLVGTDKEKIINEVSKLLMNKIEYEKMTKVANPYGDGNSSKNIVKIILKNSKRINNEYL